jgi:hypothetical protein
MKRLIIVAAFVVGCVVTGSATPMFGWYVVKYSGEAVAGPFTLLGDCTDMAKIMAKKYIGISEICRSK